MDAVVDGNTVTVTGGRTGVTATLALNIDANVTVVWKAELSGATGAGLPLVSFSGAGTFTVESGSIVQTADNRTGISNAEGKLNIDGGEVLSAYASYGNAISNSGTLYIFDGTVWGRGFEGGSPIRNNETGTVYIFGGEVKGYEIHNAGTVNILGGTVPGGITPFSTGGNIAIANISGGTVGSIYNNSPHIVNISGGTVTTSSSSSTVINNTSGTLNISGGTVENTVSGTAIYNSTGTVNVSGTATVSATSGQAIFNSTGTVNVSGTAKVSTTSGQAIRNDSTGTVNVSGTAAVSSTTGMAINNNAGGTIAVSGGTVSTTGNSPAIFNTTGTVNVSGGTVSATSSAAITNFNGMLNISGGIVKAIRNGDPAILGNSGKITISQANSGTPTLITSETVDAGTGTILNFSTLEILGGSITNTAGGNAIYNSSGVAITIGKAEPAPTSPMLVKTYNDFGSISVGGNVISGSVAEWYKVGDPNPIANANRLTYTPKAVADSGAYTARVKNTFTGMINGTVQTLSSAEWSGLSDPIYVTIMPKIVLVTAMATSKVQGTADPFFLNYTHSPLVGDVSGNYAYFDGLLGRTGSEAVGTYDIHLGTVKIYEELDDEFGTIQESKNYAIVFVGNKFTITAPLTPPTFLTGTVNPANTLGNNGDTYLNTATQDVFQKDSGVWAKVGNLKGTDGGTGGLTTQDVKNIVTQMFINGELDTAVQPIVNALLMGLLGRVATLEGEVAILDAAIKALGFDTEDLAALEAILEAFEDTDIGDMLLDLIEMKSDIAELEGLIADIATTPGTDGKSAFDLWKSQTGNESKTLNDFLASLQGTSGADGKDTGDGIAGTIGIVLGSLGLVLGAAALFFALRRKKV